MYKAIFFVFGGTALIYYASFGHYHQFKWGLPSIQDVASQYEIKKIKEENVQLKVKLKKMEFTIARYEEQNHSKNKDTHREIASEKEVFKIVPEGTKIKDHVQQDVYHWSAGKLFSLSEKEFQLKNHVASSQYGLTLLNENDSFELLDEHFYFRLGVSCIDSGLYLQEGVTVLNTLLKKFPESPLIVKAKLWRGLAFHRMNNKDEFLAMMEEFKTKYRNTKEWTVLKSIYERSIASGASLEKPIKEAKQGEQHE